MWPSILRALISTTQIVLLNITGRIQSQISKLIYLVMDQKDKECGTLKRNEAKIPYNKDILAKGTLC